MTPCPRVGLDQHTPLFPHTHNQAGGSSSQLTDTFLAQLDSHQLEQLKQQYSLDRRLYGYP